MDSVQVQSSQNIFYIKGNEQAKYASAVQIYFNSVKLDGQAKTMSSIQIDKVSCMRVPFYNNDNLCFTPCFINSALPKQLKQAYQNRFNERLNQIRQIDAQQIVVPEPTNIHHCHVCDAKITNYLEVLRYHMQHSDSQMHLRKLRMNKTHRQIKDLCESYQKKNNREKKLQKEKQISGAKISKKKITKQSKPASPQKKVSPKKNP